MIQNDMNKKGNWKLQKWLEPSNDIIENNKNTDKSAEGDLLSLNL